MQKAGKLGIASAASFGAAVSGATTLGTTVMTLARPTIEFESALSGAAKQLEGARDETGKLTDKFFKTRQEILNIARDAPIAQCEIAKIYELGLKNGVLEQDLKDFAQLAIQASEAFELPVQGLSEEMGKISTMYKRSFREMKDLMDSVNYLDDNANLARGRYSKLTANEQESERQMALAHRDKKQGSMAKEYEVRKQTTQITAVFCWIWANVKKIVSA